MTVTRAQDAFDGMINSSQTAVLLPLPETLSGSEDVNH